MAIGGVIHLLAIGAARFSNLFGIRSGLSVSGIRALQNDGGYETEEFDLLVRDAPSVQEAINDAVRFHRKP